ncbi:serine protease [Sphingomonas sp. GB1N7]|uniref:serine protease n=1 Tax=Parasphingomonas caseinilytica TaxID=3096158 RepID=UPI002FC5DED4
MWTPADIAQAIEDHAQAAADALAALQLDDAGPPLDPAALDKVAEMFGRARGEFWVEQIIGRGGLAGFAAALAAQGVAIDFGAVDLGATNLDSARLAAFVPDAQRFRCRILRGRQVTGSGTLVGPTTVLTAWHVVAALAPDLDQEPWPTVNVLLSDGRTIPAYVPPQFASACSAGEYAGHIPANDDEVADRHDVAVLRLERPAGALLGTASLPETPAAYKANAALLLVHYPEGGDHGIGIGAMTRIRKLNARWSHTVGARGGSSGGGCFDSSFTLAGIHQGKDEQMQGRLVPTARFHAQLRALVDADEAPPRMWSLDGTPDGDLVIGRQDFFSGFAAARHEGGRVRGIRVKRADAAAGLGGLGFTFRMLERLVARNPETRHCRISFEALVPDLADEIARRVTDAGIAIPPMPPAAGVAAGETASEAVGADRGRRVAEAIDRGAGDRGIQLWLFIDHPQVAFGDEIRAALEAFVDQALRLPRLRLVIAGYEAVAMPGLEFEAPPFAIDRGAPGLMLDIVSGFGESDVRLFLMDAAKAAGRTPSPERFDELIAEGLAALENVNGVYAPWLAGEVATRLRPAVKAMFA